jgi:serine protease Do
VSALLLRHGEVRRRFLGIAAKNETFATEVASKVGQPKGVRIVEIGRNTPASDGGLESNDVLLRLNGASVASIDDLQRLLALESEQVVDLTLWKREALVHRQVKPSARRAA